MATSRNSDANQKRADRILGCKQCKGVPETAETNLQGMQCTYCVNCMEVINYKMEGKVKTTKAIVEVIKEEVNKRLNITESNQLDWLKGYKGTKL